MPRETVPVTMGSPRFRNSTVPGLAVVHAWFPPDCFLPPHVHEHPTLAVMLAGSFDLGFARRSFACVPGSFSVEPAGERHENRINRRGAEVLVLQPDPGDPDHWRPFAPLFETVSCARHAWVAGLARRMAREFDEQDPYAALSLEAFALELLVSAARLGRGAREGVAPPRWLLRVQQLLHEDPAAARAMPRLAAEAGVHPAHLARSFRRQFRVSIGTYARRLRLDEAARRLAETDDGIAAIAAETGFADQSHLTREFARAYGLTPGRYREGRTLRRPEPVRPARAPASPPTPRPAPAAPAAPRW